MTDHPIVIADTRPLLEGRQTQARQIIKLPMKGQYMHPQMGGWEATTVGGGASFTIGRDGARKPAPEMVAIWHRTTGKTIVTRFQPGDRLWVRESIGRRAASFLGITATNGVEEAFYVADDDGVVNQDGFNICPWWKSKGAIPGAHMPRWASRFTLTVTDVRVQRIQDIRHADAKAEGITPFAPHRAPQGGSCDGDSSGFDDCARCAFKLQWARTNGAKTWFDNVWVVALTFTVERRTIDEPTALPPTRG